MNHRLLLPLLLAAFAFSAATIHPANAAGLLYINPPQQGPVAAGTSVIYQVKVANIDPFSGWDIMVKTDPTEMSINATSFTITPNLLVANFSGSGFELIHCVNGAGAGCTLTDGPGIVHSAFQLLSLPPQLGPSSGLLFTITYTAGSNTASPIRILSETISNGTPTPVAVTTQDAAYGLPPDFSITASPRALKIRQSSNGTSVINIASINGLSGTVSLSSTSNVAVPNRPAQLSPGSVTLASGGAGGSILTVFAGSATPVGIYSVNVTATSGAISHMVRFSINVTLPGQDFGISAGTATPASFVAGGSGTSAITMTSANSFTGKVNLASSTSNPVAGLTTSVSVNPVPLTAGGTSTSVLTFTTSASTPARIYIITVTGTNSSASDGTLSHSANVTLTVTADFTVTTGPATPASLPAGTSATSTIALNSLGFAGSISLTASTPSPVTGLTTSFSTNPVSLTAGGTGTSALTIATTSSTPVGAYTITVTGTGTGVPTRSATVTVTVINAPNLAVTSVSISNCSSSTCSATIGQTVTFTVVVANTGTVDENFTILIRWVGNNTVTQLKVITPLAHGQTSQPYTLSWDTSQAGEGSATIYAVVQPVPNEVNTADNTLRGPTLTLAAPAKPLLTSTQALIVGGGVGGVVVLLALLLLLRRRKAPTGQ